MTYVVKPLSCDPNRIRGMSERMIISHYENNHGGAVKRVKQIEEKLCARRRIGIFDAMVAAYQVVELGLSTTEQERNQEETMSTKSKLGLSIFAMSIVAAVESFVPKAHAQAIDWQKVDDTLGRKPAVSGDVHRYGFARSDLTVTLDGGAIKPSLALGGWIAFKPAHDGAMAMGDLVLLDTEVTPVVAKLTEGGFEITAIHNHLLRANPETFYVHVLGHGDPAKLASAIHDGLAASKTPLTAAAAAPSPAIDLDIAQLDQIIGVKGQNNGGVYAFAVPRREPVNEGGMQLAPVGPMGVAQAINFQPTGGGKAAITGDFVLRGDEVNPAIKTLLSNGIEVTAVHSHMLDEQPRLFFLHFWANNDTLKLAKGLRAALDKTASTKS